MSALDSLFKCNLCTSPSFQTGVYKDWVGHLASPGHQKQGRKKLDVRERWEEEDSAFIITGQVFQDGGELPFSKFDLGEWLTSFGLLGELFVDRKYGYVVFTMKDSPSKKGADMNTGLVQKFKGHEILIRPKSDYKRNEWVIYFADVDRRIAKSEMPGTRNKVNVKSQSRDNISGANAKVTKTEKAAVQKSSSTSGMPQVAQKPKPLMGERSLSTSTYGRRGSGSNFQNSSSTRTNNHPHNRSNSNSSGAFKGSHFERPGPSSKAPDRSTSNQGFSPSNFRKGPTNSDNPRHTTTKGASATRHAQNKVDVDPNVGNRWAPIDQYLQNNPSLPDFSTYHQSRKNDNDNAKRKNFFPSHQHHQPKGTQKTDVKTAFPPTTPEHLTVTVSSTSAAAQQGSPSSSEANAESTFDFRGGFSSSFNAGRVVTITSGPSSSPMPNHPETQHAPQTKSQPYTQEGSNRPVPPFKQQYPVLPMARPILPQPLLAPNAVQNQRPRQPAYRHGHPQNDHQARPRTLSKPSPNFIQAIPIPYHIRKSVVNPAAPVSSSTGNPSPYVIVKPSIPYFSNLFDSLICPGKGGVPKKLKEDFNSHDLLGQLQEFYKAQSLTDEEARLRWQLIVDLLFLLKLEHPMCQLYPFGSILTGLGDFDSDIDIFVDLDGNSQSLASSREEDTRSKTVILDIVKKILRKSQCPHTYSRFLTSLIPVKSARVPILKLTHAFSKINCDLSFENRLSVQNSKLLLFYLNWDDRIMQFMKLIRFWAKFHKISGSNYIKNYAIALLVLVFLCEKSILPSVHLLQTLEAEERKRKRNSQNPDEICGWDASFTDKVGLIRKHFNAKPFHGCNFGSSQEKERSHKVLICMAKEFFQRWANVDFNSVVVCPLLGEVLPREKFMPGEEENLPQSLERYINWAKQQPLNRRLNLRTNLCIQDPFLLSFNVGSVTTDGTLFKFQIACAKTHQLLEKSEDLKSLLDVFCPLPSHVGDKKFLRVYRAEQRKEELLMEIKSALNLKNESVAEEQSEKSEVTKKKPKSVYVDLPTHLLHLEPYMDEQALKALDRKGRWESFLEFSLSSVFESIFVTEITRCKMQTCQKMNMLQTLTQLWIDFTSDFFDEFFVEGLKLKVAEDMKKSVYGCESDETAIKEDARKPRWNLKTLTKKEEAYFGISNKNSVEVDMMLRKIISFQEKLNGKNQFRRIVMDADYPFWEKRPGIMEEVRKKMEVDQIVIPMLPKKEEKRDKKRGNKRGSAPSSKGGGKEKEKPNQLVCFNPITLEGMVSDEIKESIKKDEEKEKDTKFSSFKINMLIKTEVKWGHEKPRLFIIFEENGKAIRSEMMRALQSISYILDYTYPDYLNWRLGKYLDMVEVCSSKSNMMEQIGKMDYLEEVISKTEEQNAPDMKKKRTKLEEDLLIPSSSSSAASVSDDDDDDEDEKPEENEEEVKQEEKQEDDNDNALKTEKDVENV